MCPVRSSQEIFGRSFFCRTMLPLPSQTVQKGQIGFVIGLNRGQRCFLCDQTLVCEHRTSSLSAFFEILLYLLMHTLVKVLTRVSVSLFVKVVLIRGKGFF